MNKTSTIWHPFTSLNLQHAELEVVSSNGSKLLLKNGSELIDCISSWWVITHGHCNAEIIEAVSKQVATLDHVLFAGFTHEPAQELVSLLNDKIPFDKSWFYFSDNGSTSVEVALKLAWQYWKNKSVKKQSILAFNGGYHGDTFGSMSVGDRSIFTEPFSDLLFNVERLPLPGNNPDEYLSTWKEVCASKKHAAFIYEPLIQGAGGMRIYSADVLNLMISIAKEHNIICIADEVMTGFGRTGTFLASDQMKNKPDIICLSKGITGGVLPLGMTVVNEKIASEFMDAPKEKTFYHGHSFTGNPISCAAACANIKLFTSDTFKAINNISESHLSFITKINSHTNILRAESIGTILVLELKSTNQGYLSEIRDKAYNYFIKKGLLIRPLGNIIYLMPPYCISNSELNKMYNEIEMFLDLEITH